MAQGILTLIWGLLNSGRDGCSWGVGCGHFDLQWRLTKLQGLMLAVAPLAGYLSIVFVQGLLE